MATTKYDMTHVDAMNGHEFEHFIAALLRKLGYQNVDVTRGSGDQGVDVLAEKEGVRYAVQCKCYSSDIGNTPVQEVNTGKVIYHCHVGVVVTNRHFTQGAKDAAKATGVLLWDRAKLHELMAQAELMTQSMSNEDALLKRGFMALEDGEWHKAESFFEQVLNLNAECGDAYLGKVLAAVQVTSLSQLREKTIQLDDYKDFSRAMQFSSGVQLQALQEVNELMKKKWQAKEYDERRRKEEEARIAEEQRKAWITKVSPFWKFLRERNQIIAGSHHTTGLKADGTVITVGLKCVQPDWENIVAIAARDFGTMGLKANGTVVEFSEGGKTCAYDKVLSSWTNIVAVASGMLYIAGLKRNGTVVTVGRSFDISMWSDIVMIAAGLSHIVGLKSDGTVVVAGSNDYGQCNVSGWRDIVAVAAGYSCTIGLKSDGTVVATGRNDYGQCNVSGWKSIVSIAAEGLCTVGLRDDGTVIAIGHNAYGRCNVSSWKNIVAIATGGGHTVGLKSDGTVVAVGENSFGQCNVSDWKLFDSIETLEQERAAAGRARVEEEERQRQEAAEQRWQEERQHSIEPF